jgi:hypothetical protein
MRRSRMTKKAERAARIAADKRNAYVKKVRLLIGHVQERLPAEYVNAAYGSGKTADEFAAEIAAREPVGKAVHPLKVEAVKEAREHALKIIYAVARDLAEHDWDREKAAPYPDSRVVSREEYKQRLAKYSRYRRLTSGLGPTRGMNDPDPCEMDEEGMSAFIISHEEQAAFQYDMFIVKLVAKIGPCISATLEGNHVWSHSILVVEKEGGVIERWKTQQITNVSKLGLYFPQWPSRLMK